MLVVGGLTAWLAGSLCRRVSFTPLPAARRGRGECPNPMAISAMSQLISRFGTSLYWAPSLLRLQHLVSVGTCLVVGRQLPLATVVNR